MSHPDGLPEFFLDRSLGRKKVPALLRSEGVRLTTLAEYYGVPEDEDVDDVTWLELAGVEGWPVLMKDERIRWNPAERAAVLRYGVRAFCLTRQDLSAEEMAARFVVRLPAIGEAFRSSEAACIYAVQKNRIEQLTLDFGESG